MKITRFIAITCIFMILLSIVGYNVSAKETDGKIAPVGCENCDLGRFMEAPDELEALIEEASAYLQTSGMYTQQSAHVLWDEVSTGKEVLGSYTDLYEFEDAIDRIKTAIDALILADSYIIGNVITADVINIKDATAIQKHIAGIITLSNSSLLLADTNGDNAIDIKDATTIQKYIAGIFVAPCYIGDSPYQEPEGIKIGDNIYLVSEGDIITYQVSLQADKLFENIQAVINYDSDMLELIRILPDDPDEAVWAYEGEYRCPNLDMVIFNADLKDKVVFNASRIAGYDFMEEKVLINLDFKVKSTKYCEIDFVMEYMTIKGDGSESYFYDAKPVITDGIIISEYLSMPCY